MYHRYNHVLLASLFVLSRCHEGINEGYLAAVEKPIAVGRSLDGHKRRYVYGETKEIQNHIAEILPRLVFFTFKYLAYFSAESKYQGKTYTTHLRLDVFNSRPSPTSRILHSTLQFQHDVFHHPNQIPHHLRHSWPHIPT